MDTDIAEAITDSVIIHMLENVSVRNAWFALPLERRNEVTQQCVRKTDQIWKDMTYERTQQSLQEERDSG